MFIGNASIVHGRICGLRSMLGVDFESDGLEDFGKSDMERRGNFGFIDVESFVSIREDVVVGRII